MLPDQSKDILVSQQATQCCSGVWNGESYADKFIQATCATAFASASARSGNLTAAYTDALSKGLKRGSESRGGKA